MAIPNKVIEIRTLGPQGPIGPQGPSGSGNAFVNATVGNGNFINFITQNNNVVPILFNNFLGTTQTSSMLAPYVLNTQTSSFVLNTQTSSFVRNTQTSSFVQNFQTSSFLVTASVNLNTITFTKGDSNQFSITVDTGSGEGTAGVSSLEGLTGTIDLIAGSGISITTSSNNIIITNTGGSGNIGPEITGSLIKTASALADTITFTKGDGTNFTTTITYVGLAGNADNIDIDNVSNNTRYGLVLRDGNSGTYQKLYADTEEDTPSWNPSTNTFISPIISASSFTGSLSGTSSWAINSQTASFLPIGTYSITASWAQSASNAINAQTSSFLPVGTYSITSSWATNALTASYVLNAVSSSFTTTASYASNGGVTQILAGPNITLSPTNGLGQVTITSTGGGGGSFNTATGSYGSFYDTTTQTNPVANVPRSMSFDSTDITNGVSISGSTNPFNTYIKTVNAGIYNIQFSAQVEKTDSGTDEIVIWLRKNGIDLTDSATKLTLSGNGTKVVAAWNWFVSSAANDYYQIIWVSADTGMRLYAEPINDTPGIPSVILTVNRVDQFLSNTGSFTGSFTGAFTGSLLGTSTTASYYQETDPIFVAKSASLATTGSNNFNGNQTIIGSLLQGLEGNIATGEYSHAEGSITKAIGNYSHAEGDFTQAKGDYSHAEGQETIASGSYSHAEGYQTIALGDRQHVTGQYNFVSPVQSAFIVGNGTDNNNRSNLIYAHNSTVEITGSLEVNGGITGSLFGTSSWANNALTASYALNTPTSPPQPILFYFSASITPGDVPLSGQVIQIDAVPDVLKFNTKSYNDVNLVPTDFNEFYFNQIGSLITLRATSSGAFRIYKVINYTFSDGYVEYTTQLNPNVKSGSLNNGDIVEFRWDKSADVGQITSGNFIDVTNTYNTNSVNLFFNTIPTIIPGGTEVSTLSYTGSGYIAGAIPKSANLTINSLTSSLLGTSSWATNALTTSFTPNAITTASVNLNTITFTKGSGATFNITVDTGSGGGGVTVTNGDESRYVIVTTGDPNTISGESGLTYGSNLLTVDDTIRTSYIELTSSLAKGSSEGFIIKYGGTPTEAGFLYYLSGNNWLTSSLTLVSSSLLAIAITTNSSGGMLLQGVSNHPSIQNLTPGQVLYLSGSGVITPNVPTTSGQQVRVVGYGLSGSNYVFNPSTEYVTLA
jgi:hypothetical protein